MQKPSEKRGRKAAAKEAKEAAAAAAAAATDECVEYADETVSKSFNKHMEVLTKATLQNTHATRMSAIIMYIVYLVSRGTTL